MATSATEEDEILARLTRVARSDLGLAEDVRLTIDTVLSEVVWLDSVRLMAFVEAVEAEFDIEFDIDDLSGEAVTNVGLLTGLVRGQLG
ncbi:MAG: phosphopantetheine-binding protein [Pseudonocardia sp.]|nr:phosphopantetheine-binding protein [Pseudonocardia sp.]